MDQIKIVFFDIDGTLVSLGQTDMSPKTKQALRQLQQKGITIGLATGRAMASIPAFEGITFDVILAFNGSLCVAQNEIILKQVIPTRDVKQIIENAKQLGRPVSIATAQQTIANGSDRDLEEYFAVAHQKVVVSDAFNDYANDDIFQIMLGCDLEERKEILLGTNHARITAWWDRAIDIIPIKSGKGRAIQAILDYYQFSQAESLAFGDGANDIEMLQAVGTGVAMGNAAEDVKQTADHICGHVTEDGIYDYLRDHKLID